MGTKNFNHPASGTRRASFGTVLAICASGLLVASCAPKFNHQGTTSADTVNCGEVESPGTGLACPQHASFGKNDTSNIVVAGYGNNKIHVICNPASVGGAGTGMCANVSAGNVVASGGSAGVNGDIYTVAGTGYPVNSGDGGAAANAGFYQPTATAVDSAGNIIIAVPTFHTIRVVCLTAGSGVCTHLDATGKFIDATGVTSVTAGDVYTLAGNVSAGSSASTSTNNSFGFSGDSGPAYQATLSYPKGIAIDTNDNLVIADQNNERVRVVCQNSSGVCSSTLIGGVATAGDIYTIAGNGTAGYLGDTTAASGSELNTPSSVAVDGNGNIAVSDEANYRVRVICGSTSGICSSKTAGNIYTVAGNGSNGNINAGGTASTSSIGMIYGVGFDTNGNLFISDPVNAAVSVVCTGSLGICGHTDGSGNIVSGDSGSGSSGNIYGVADFGSSQDYYVSSLGYTSGSFGAGFSGTTHAVGFSPNGNYLIVSDRDNNVVRFMFY